MEEYNVPAASLSVGNRNGSLKHTAAQQILLPVVERQCLKLERRVDEANIELQAQEIRDAGRPHLFATPACRATIRAISGMPRGTAAARRAGRYAWTATARTTRRTEKHHARRAAARPTWTLVG